MTPRLAILAAALSPIFWAHYAPAITIALLAIHGRRVAAGMGAWAIVCGGPSWLAVAVLLAVVPALEVE